MGDRPPDDEYADGRSESSRWGWIQLGLIIVVLGFAIGELVVAVQNQGMSHQAVVLARNASADATEALQAIAPIANLTEQVSQLGTQEDNLEEEFTNLTGTINGLRSVVLELRSASSSFASALASITANLPRSTNPEQSASSIPEWSSGGGGSSSGAIAGGVIGAIVGIAVLAGMFCFCAR